MPVGSSDEYSDDDDLMIFPLTDINVDDDDFKNHHQQQQKQQQQQPLHQQHHHLKLQQQQQQNNDHQVPRMNSNIDDEPPPSPFSPIDDDDDDDDDSGNGSSGIGRDGERKKLAPLDLKTNDVMGRHDQENNHHRHHHHHDDLKRMMKISNNSNNDNDDDDTNNNLSSTLNHPPGNSFRRPAPPSSLMTSTPQHNNVTNSHHHHHHHNLSSSCSSRLNWMKALRLVKSLKDPWEKFHITDHRSEFATRHRYHALRKQWVTDVVEVKMEDEPFDQGAMRCCYRIKKMPTFGKHKDWKHAHNYVAKSYIAKQVGREVYFSDVRLQMDAKLWGEEYNRHNPPKKVDIVQMCVLEFNNRPAGQQFYHLEHFIEGHYTKYNSNSGFVEESLRMTPQAFSHFTFERSGHQLIVVDIQGVGDLWTDPQIHSVDDIYGDGNLGTKGMALFFHSHKCNSICESLGLSKFDLAPSEINLNNDVYNDVIMKRHATPATRVRGEEEQCVAASPIDRTDLHSFLQRSRNMSTCSSTVMSADDDVSDDDGIGDDDDDSPMSSMYGSITHQHNLRNNNLTNHISNDPGNNEDHFNCASPMLFSPPVRKPRQRFYSESEECMSLSRAEEQYRLQFEFDNQGKARPACVEHELNLRNKQQIRKLCDSVLGQIHHDLAKYHEMGRFCEKKSEVGEVDLEAALFHERYAADLGVKEAMLILASIYLDMPRELLIGIDVEKTEENQRKGMEYMVRAAEAGDRGAMLYVAHAFETGEIVGEKGRSLKKAVDWYESVLNMSNDDEVGEYDATGDTPPYEIMARVAKLYLDGGEDLPKDPSYAGDLYTRAAENATQAMKGRLANKYYALAEEAWTLVEEE